MSLHHQNAVVQSAVTFGCQLTLRSEEHGGFMQVHGANESPTLRMERNNYPLLAFESSIFSLVREGFVGLVTEKEIRYNTIVCLVNNATRTTANVQLTDGSERGLRVVMHASTRSTALRISPKFKTHSSSEFVHHGDKVAFNLDETDLFLRVAEREDGVWELVAASEPTVFDLKRFDRGAAQQYCSMQNYVQAGRTLSIYHRVHDMFLSHSPVEADKRMLRKAIKRNTQWQVVEHQSEAGRHSFQGDECVIREKAAILLKYSNVFFSEALTSGALEIVDPGAAGLWVVEAADPTVGGPLRINEMYRLRHFASSQYLAVRDVRSSELDFQVTVIDPDAPDMPQDTLFDIEAPMDDDLGHVSTVQSVVRFRHVRTGKFLSTLDTTGTVITPATIHEKGHNRDRLRLRHIPDHVESELQFAVGHLRHFQGWIEYFEGLQNMPRSLMSIVASRETRAVVVRTVESLLALIDLVCRPPAQPQQNKPVAGVGGQGGGGSGSGQAGGKGKGGGGGGGLDDDRDHHSNSSLTGGGAGGVARGGGSTASVTVQAHASLSDKLGLPDPIRQRRLHELGVEPLLLRVALAPFQMKGANSLTSIPVAGGAISLADVGAKECTPIVTAVRLCFQLLRCIVKGSPQHCHAAQHMVEMLMYLESHQLHVAPAILAVLQFGGLMSCCRQLLLLNDQAPSAPYIDAIAHFCTSESNVMEVLALIGQHPKTLVRTAVEYGRLMCAHHTIGRQGGANNEDALLSVESHHRSDETIEAVTFDVFITQEDAPVISYFVATLRLFLAIARHGGTVGMDYARGLVAREEVLIVLGTSFKDTRNQNQADIVKATYAELATTLYLSGEAQRATVGGLSPVIVDPTGTLKGTAARAIGAGTQTNEHGQSLVFGSQFADGTFLRQLKISALEFIKEHPVQVIELTGRNQMMWNCISIWHVFVSMRTASVAELKEVIPLLLNVLDGATDVQSLVTLNRNWDRYVLGEDSLNVLKTKTEICSLLETFVKQLQDEFIAIVNERLALGKDNAEQIVALGDAQVSELIGCLNIPRLVHILLDLVLYESQELMNAATSLLTTVCRWRRREQELASDMKLLPAGSERLFQALVDTCCAIKDSDAEERGKAVDRFVSLYNGPVAQDETARTIAGKPGVKVVLFEALRAWRVHEAVLEVLPRDALQNIPLYQTCIEFFLIFCRLPKNADIIAEHWPTFFTAMQRAAAAAVARAAEEEASGGGDSPLNRRVRVSGPGTPTIPNSPVFGGVIAAGGGGAAAAAALGASSNDVVMLAKNKNINMEIQAPVLALLRLIWARGNRLTPVQHADIKFVVSLVDAVDSLEVMPTIAALLSQGIPSHQLQRDVLNILIDFDLLKPNWWVRLHGQMTSNMTNVLELCAAGGNPYTNSIVTSRLPLVVVVRQLHSTGMSRVSAKCTLVRFATVAHFSDTAASRVAAETTDVILGEMWWRLLRDDFMVRLDELPAALDVNDSLKQYIVELSTLLTCFFENRFQLSEVLRFDAILKELRHIAATMQHVCSSLPHMRHLTPSERFVLYKLGKAVQRSLSQLKDHSVQALTDCIGGIDEKALLDAPVETLRKPVGVYAAINPATNSSSSNNNNTPSSSPPLQTAVAAGGGGSGANSRSQSAAAPGAAGATATSMSGGGGIHRVAAYQDTLVHQDILAAEHRQHVAQQRLNELRQVMVKRADADTTMDILVGILASLDFHDIFCWKQRVIRRLLLAVQRQQFEPEAICVILIAVRKCIESLEEMPKEKIVEMQNMMESLGALPVCTRLFDAVNTDIIIESLRLGIATLLDGNTRVQNHFLDYLLATEEKMFFAIKRCCERSSLELYYWRRSQKSASQEVDLHGGNDLVFSYLKLMLRFLQLLCEGHNLGLQEYVREQHDNIRSINTLHCVTHLMKTLLLGATQPVEEELIQCFELCTEVCQGPCANNQLALISSGCGTIINTTLLDPTVSLDVKSSAVTTLLSLLEGCTDPQVAEVIERAVPVSTLEDLYKLPISDDASDSVVYSVGIFLRLLHDLFKGKRRAVKIHEILSSRPDIARKTGIIQIERSAEIERVYFRIPDACLNIRRESKRRLLWDVDRSSQSAKLASFVEIADDLILEMDLTEQHIVTSFEAARARLPEFILKYLPVTVNPAVEYWIFLSTSLALFHNFLFLFDIFNIAVLNMALGVMQLFLSCCIIFIDWQVASNVYFHKYKKQKRQIKLEETHSGASSGVAPVPGTPSSSSSSSKGGGAGGGGGGGSSDDANAGSSSPSSSGDAADSAGSGGGALDATKKHLRNIQVSPVRELVLRLSRPRALQSIGFLLFAVLGTLKTPYCLGVHLMWVIELSPAFQNVVAAITLNAKTLSLTIVLGMLFIYFFSMIGYTMFPEDFDTDDDPRFQENCASLMNCFLFMLTTGLRQGGGVGDVMRPKSWKQPQFVARKIFDFSFFALMIIVFLNILFGIIIDTFAELRDAKTRKEDDMRLRCFVCGIDSHVFDRHGEGFLWHIKHEHSMWQYLYFLHHLRVKDPSNYTGQESYISRLLGRKDFSFFPQRCLSLEGKYDRNTDEHSGDADAAASGGGGGGGVSTKLTSSASGGAAGGGAGGSGAVMMMAHSQHAGFDPSQALQQHFDKLALQLRRAMVSNSQGRSGAAGDDSGGGAGGGVGGRGGGNSSGRQGGSRGSNNNFRSSLDVATQTVGGDTLVSLQFQLQQAQNEIKRLVGERKDMQTEMKSQVEEVWKLKSQVQGQIDARNRIHALEFDLANKHRECDLSYAERDAVLRQNAFLQTEADRLLVSQTQQDVAHRMRGPQTVHPSPLHQLRESMLQRSMLYDALQIPEKQQQHHGDNNKTSSNNNIVNTSLSLDNSARMLLNLSATSPIVPSTNENRQQTGANNSSSSNTRASTLTGSPPRAMQL